MTHPDLQALAPRVCKCGAPTGSVVFSECAEHDPIGPGTSDLAESGTVADPLDEIRASFEWGWRGMIDLSRLNGLYADDSTQARWTAYLAGYMDACRHTARREFRDGQETKPRTT